MSISPDALDEPAEPTGTLFGISVAAFVAYWVLTPAVYVAISGHPLLSTTQPTSQPAIGPHDLVALSIVSPIVGLATLIVGNLLWLKRPFSRAGLTLAHLFAGGWMFGFISACIVVPCMMVVVYLTQKLWDLIHFAHPNEHDLLRVLGVEPSVRLRVAIVVSAVLLAPCFEEFFFRGMVQRAVRFTTRNRWAAIITTSMIFTAVHGALWLAPPIFVLSLCLGYLYERTRNLWVPMIVHAAFNATSVVTFLLHK